MSSDKNDVVLGYSTLDELFKSIEALGYNHKEVVVDISRTPLESLYGCGHVSYGDPPREYECVGYGPDVNTPQGLLPEIVLLVRQDVANQIIPHDGA